MKKLIIASLIFASGGLFAQSTISTDTAAVTARPVKTSGVRASVTFSSLALHSEARGYGQITRHNQNLGQSVGLAIGYAQLPLRKLGYIASANYSKIDVGNSDNWNLGRIEGNAAYAFTGKTFAKAGLNVSDILDKGANMTPNVGGQIGAGINIGAGLSADATAIATRQSTNTAGNEIDLMETGIEVGLTGTF